MTIPNFISVFRLLLVPVIVLLIIERDMYAAFWIFVVAGVSDAVDGIIARHWNASSDLGAYLDPIADKSLLVTIYVCLAIVGELPAWLVVAVVSRDVLIVGAVILSWAMDRPVAIKPLMVSKANTVAQIVLASMVLGATAFSIPLGGTLPVMVAVTGLLTIVSTGAYLVEWLRHMASEPTA